MSKSKRKLKRVPAQPGSASEQNDIPALDELVVDDESVAAPQPAEAQPAEPQLAESNAPNLLRATHQTDPSFLAKLAGVKKQEYKSFIDPELPHEFERAAWKHFMRYPLCFMLVILNVALVMSFAERLPRHQTMDPLKELFFFGVVGFIDVFMLIPAIFEVNKVKTDSTGIKLSTLFWRVRLGWEQLVAFEQPKFLKFSILRTTKTFYLLNKYDLKPYYELAEIISAKMPAPIEDKNA
ncbi:MAG: hypothetical protein SGJ27_04330 [Candidatus Melainabacteria bacterium]|nr:hypothetical protein [Candidatus Melainabacteria bacterium]